MSTSPPACAALRWRVRDRLLDSRPRALVMGIVNATPDSFSGHEASTGQTCLLEP